MVDQPPTPSEERHETLESVRESLREAQRKLAYYERFGPMLEGQMSTVVTKAAEVAAESEQNRTEAEHEVARLRQEAEALRAECEWRRAEATSIIAEANHEAAGILSKARGEVSTIVNSALAQLEQAQKDVLRSTGAVGHVILPTSREPVDLTPPVATHTEWRPVVQGHAAPEPPQPEARATELELSDRVVELPIPSAVAAEPDEASADDAIVTYLTVRSHMKPEALPQFGRALEALPGVRGTAVARVSEDAVELVVAHHRDTDLLANMRSIQGLEFRLVARGEGMVEIEVLERNAPRLRA